jgi:alkanesulfonate monooxygenase SsuD/methylene tetrahydromethanopterin reductase-like flavin-dependent oxidoreductase (luciferase family)
VRDAVDFFVQAEQHTALVQQAKHRDEFVLAGTPKDVKAQLRRLFDSGADSVGLWLFPADHHADVMRRIAHEVR